MKRSIHDHEPEQVIANEAKELLLGECDPFDLVNFINGISEALHAVANKDMLTQALRDCDTAKVGLIVVNAVEDYYADLAEYWATERYENHELDYKYEA